jgi:hypothetical protein
MAIGAFFPDVMTRVVNVKWTEADQQWLLGIAGPDPGNNTDAPLKAEANDGPAYKDKRHGVSGTKITAITDGFVDYGEIKTADGNETRACFMRNEARHSSDISLGTVVDGSIRWQSAGSADGEVVAISHANDAFFIAYKTGVEDDINVGRLAITRNGVNFRAGINPFPVSIMCGNVAYAKPKDPKDSGTYVCVGTALGDDGDPNHTSFSLCWSVSTDGTSWSGHAEPNGLTGIGGGHLPGELNPPTDLSTQSNVAYGNGLFVAAASRKNVFEGVNNAYRYVLSSCAVAVSINGSDWTLLDLPGAVVRSSHELGDRAGRSIAVRFVKDKDYRSADPVPPGVTPAKIEGYFVVTGGEQGGSHPGGFEPYTAKMWQGDGYGWHQIKTENSDVFHPTSYAYLSAIDKKLETVTIL